jgi:hypothetical protein
VIEKKDESKPTPEPAYRKHPDYNPFAREDAEARAREEQLRQRLWNGNAQWNKR